MISKSRLFLGALIEDNYLSKEDINLNRMATAQYVRTLQHIAKPFLESGVYKSQEAFVKDLVKDVASRKVRTYQKKIRTYEARHGSFEQYSKIISGSATPRQEDQWMEWEAARDLLKAWKRVAKELGSSAA